MNQNYLVDSGIQSSKTYRLKQPLAAALASLEVQLDQELARYRRTRIGSKTLSQSRVGRFTSNPPQQLTGISMTGGRSQRQAEDTHKEDIQSVGLATAKAAPTAQEYERHSALDPLNNTPPQLVVETEQKVPATANVAEMQHPEAVTSASAPVSSKTETQYDSIPEDSVKTKNIPTSTSVTIVNRVAKEQTKIPVTEFDKTSDDTRTQPEDYLESSEALLRSLTEEQPKAHKQPTNPDSLLSPLGIGSMLLLLLGSMTFGYLAYNAKGLPQLSLSGLLNQNTPKIADGENTEESAENTTVSAQPTLTPMPKYPNLAADEFPEVRNSNDVVSLKPKAKPLATASPNPVSAQTPTNSTTQQTSQPIMPSNAPPTSTVATSSQKPTTEKQLSANGFYRVVMENKDDNALFAARKIVSDAYLSTDGKLIYLGALKNPEKAQQLLQELQAKGIKARILQPEKVGSGE